MNYLWTKDEIEYITKNYKNLTIGNISNYLQRTVDSIKKKAVRLKLTKQQKHKQSKTRLYRILKGMKQRCCNINDKRYHRYGGRGISVCEEWRNSFTSFRDWALNNGYRDDLSIDRINNDGNYCPENCRWATPKEQANNTSKNKKKV
jgi:hypothetical protein